VNITDSALDGERGEKFDGRKKEGEKGELLRGKHGGPDLSLRRREKKEGDWETSMMECYISFLGVEGKGEMSDRAVGGEKGVEKIRRSWREEEEKGGRDHLSQQQKLREKEPAAYRVILA